MEIKVIWTNFAKSELKKIFVYYAENVNSQIAKNIVTGIVTESKRLKKNPEIGQIEELLKEIGNYRYLIYQNFKLVYYYNDFKNSVEIFDVFDTRQNPAKMTRAIK